MAQPFRCFAASLLASFSMSVTPAFADGRAGIEALPAKYEQDPFLLWQCGNDWKIARYIFLIIKPLT